MIRKVLVANRGEIARRIFRTCRAMGIATVAVFSEPDRHAPFVSDADEAYALNGVAAAETYLLIEAMVAAARATGADAVHPGYGFLAENAGLAEAVIAAGLTWIGPTPRAIAAMGSKLESKRLVAAAGVPVLPSVDLTSIEGERLRAAALVIGYPVLVKASAGGGGKGMRIVRSSEDLEVAVAGARREAGSAFGDDTVFLERYLDSPRHIEVQIFGDHHGNLVALFERECSIQRRHQKIIEEAPSPALDEATRQQMSEAAVTTARTVAYEGAGTVEFLFQEGEFFFLEMNTRLQVEHPVTEEITGLDLVRLQLLVAQGEALPEAVLAPDMVGHAIEARLYAEDPRHDFLPVTGKLAGFEVPDLPGIRVESGVENGSEISLFYDPMIAKVVAWAETRAEAASLLAAALQRARLHGLITNRDLLVRILRHPEFLAGQIDTHFLERHSPVELGAPLPDQTEVRLAAVAAALAAQADRRLRTPLLGSIPSGWRNSPSQLQEATFETEYGLVTVGYRFEARGGITVGIDGAALEGARLVHLSPERVGLAAGRHLRWFTVARMGSIHHVDGPAGYVRLVEQPRFPAAPVEEEKGSLHSPMPGKVIKVMVNEGQEVAEGEVLLVMEAMKMEHTLRAPHGGVVRAIRAAAGDQVEADQVLVVVEG
ncbi:MAG TPA: biotin carboxylase N-terminal domain-containing protein [Acidimicrobiia bacterium]|nr:biotin carboxylase N-terminal domain-containing protein [Acidimicrobiia bacterium]